MRNAFADEITKLADSDPRLILLSGDIGNHLFDNLKDKHPARFFNCGVAEANMMGVAAGMALSGLRPVVYTIAPFTTMRCLEQIRVDVAYHNAPVVIVGTGSGLSYASLGPTHHSLEDFSIFRAIPKLQVITPYDAPSLRSVLRDALAGERPTYIRIGKKGEPEIVPECDSVGIGKAKVVRNGTDACILAVGTIAYEALKAADILIQNYDISAQVILINTVKPLDRDLLSELATKFRKIVTVEEHSKAGGFGEYVSAHIAQSRLPLEITCLGCHDDFMHSVGSQAFARTYFKIDADSIVEAIAMNTSSNASSAA